MQQVATPLSESFIELIIKKNKCSLISYCSYMKYRERFYPNNKFQLLEFNLLV